MFQLAEASIQRLRSEQAAASALTRPIKRVGLRQNGIQVSIKLPIPSYDGGDAATSNDFGCSIRPDADETAWR